MKDGTYASPAVSVILSCYNCASFVGECLDSVLAQDMPDFEVIAVDDGSTDETPQVLSRFAVDPRVRVVTLERCHGGPSRARNVGITASRGSIITVLDADDLLRPHALRSLLDFTARAPEVGLVFFNADEVDYDSGRQYGSALTGYDSFWNLARTKVGEHAYVVDDPRTYRQLVQTNFIRTSGTTIPRRVFDVIGTFDERLTNADDFDMWLRIARRYHLGFIDSPGSAYRRRKGNISARGHKLMACQIRVLEKQLEAAQGAQFENAVQEQLAVRYRSLAWGLRAEGRFKEARAQYYRSIRLKMDYSAVRGWLLTWLRLRPEERETRS